MMDNIEIAVTMRKANRALRSLFPDYDAKAEPVRELIRRAMQQSGKDVLDAALPLMQEAQEDRVHVMWLLAAAVDLIENKSPEERARAILRRIGIGEHGI